MVRRALPALCFFAILLVGHLLPVGTFGAHDGVALRVVIAGMAGGAMSLLTDWIVARRLKSPSN
jgi:hypothetical protein